MEELSLISRVVRVKNTLAELGETPDDIARSLHEFGVIGKRSDCAMCPVARFVARRFSEYAVTVDLDHVTLMSDTNTCVIDTPGCIYEFIVKFDDGEYLNLVMS